MTGSPPLVFSSARRAKRPRWTRVLFWVVVVLVVVAVLIGLLAASLWGYAWTRLGGDDVPALIEEVDALGAEGARAPSRSTNLLVTMTAPRDPTSPRGPELADAVWLVQAGGPREVPAVLLLPQDLPVPVDGEGVTTLAEVQVADDSSGLVRAISDYTGVRIDHVVSLEEDALPTLVDHLGPVEVCTDGGCREGDTDGARRELGEASSETRPLRATEWLRALAGVMGPLESLRSPLATKRAIDTVAQVHTDVSLRGMGLLELARVLDDAPAPDVVTVPMLRNPQTGSRVLLEAAQTIFQRFAEGAPLDGVGGDDGLQQVIGEVPVVVFNAAGIQGLAASVETRLRAAGFQVIGTDNAPSFDDAAPTVIRYGSDDPAAEATAILLAERLPDAELEPVDRVPDFDGEPVGVQVLAGADLDDGG